MFATRNASRRIGRRFGAVAAIGVLLTSAACSSAGGSDDDLGTDTQQTLYEEAAKANRGKVTVFIGTTATQQLEDLAERFNRQYPDITIEYVTGTGDQVSERFMTEKRADLNTADVVILPGLESFEPVEEYIEEYVPEGAENFTYDEAGYIEGIAYAYSGYRGGVCYNEANVSDDEAKLLETYEGWVDPAFKDRAVVTSPAGFHYRRNLAYWLYSVPSLGEKWFKQLGALDPVVTDDPNSLVPQVVAGEYDVLYNIGSLNGIRAAEAGTPLKCVVADPAPITMNSVGLAKDAPNPSGAKLFENWLLTEKGQTAVVSTLGYEPRYKDMSVDVDGFVPTADKEELVDEDMVSKRYDELVETFDNNVE